MKKAIVVIRQMASCRPVCSAVIEADSDTCDHDDVDEYLKEKAQEHIDNFKRQFVEFLDAEFWIDPVQILRT